MAANSVACSPDGGVTTTENAFYRSFDLGFFGIVGEYTTVFLEIGIETNSGTVDYPAVVVVYNDVNGAAPLLADLDELASLDLVIPPGFTGIMSVPLAATVPANGTAVVEFSYPHAQDFGGNGGMWPGSNPSGQTAPSYIWAESCDLPEIVTLVSLGFPNIHLVFKAHRVMVCGGSEILSASPADGAVDARQPHPPGDGMDQDPALRQGIGSSDEPIVLKIDAAGNAANCFELCETAADGILGPNGIASVTECPAGTYSIVLNHAIAPGAWTSISVGTVSVSYNSHPGNVDAGQFSNASDVLALIDILNGAAQPVWGDLSLDLDHSGVADHTDIVRVIDLLNGAIPYAVWNGVEAPTNTCP